MTATPTQRLGDLVHSAPVPVLAAASGAAVIAVAVLAWRATRVLRGKKAADTLTVVAAAMASSVAATGMWHFFTRTMHLPAWIQTVLFAFMEIAVLASALRARAAVAREGHAGADGLAVWVLTCASGFMSATEATSPQEALVRLGAPLVAAWLWERSMVPERRARRAARGLDVDGAFAKIKRSAKERFLASLGVTAPDQSALEIRQDRALTTVVRLSVQIEELDVHLFVATRRKRLRRRLDKAMLASGAPENPNRQRMIVDRLAVIRHAGELGKLAIPSPWTAHLPAPTDSNLCGAHSVERSDPTDTGHRLTQATAADPGASRPTQVRKPTRNEGRPTDRLADPTDPAQTAQANRPTATAKANGRAIVPPRPGRKPRSEDELQELVGLARTRLDGRTPTEILIRTELGIGAAAAREVRDRLKSAPTGSDTTDSARAEEAGEPDRSGNAHDRFQIRPVAADSTDSDAAILTAPDWSVDRELVDA